MKTRLVTVDETTDVKKTAAKKLNIVAAMANCSMAFACKTIVGMTFKSVTEECPTRKSSAFTALLMMKKHAPDDTVRTQAELRQEMKKIKMKKNDDPAELFQKFGGN
jgi:hypothetical protein